MFEGKYFLFTLEKGVGVLTLNRPPYNIFEAGFYVELGEVEDVIAKTASFVVVCVGANNYSPLHPPIIIRPPEKQGGMPPCQSTEERRRTLRVRLLSSVLQQGGMPPCFSGGRMIIGGCKGE